MKKKDSNTLTILNDLAEYVIRELKEKGIVIQRYDSYGTNSIYLKLDYGVSNSIRISDHKGKKHLSYRYNVLTCCPSPIATKDHKGYIRFYFPIHEREILIRKILHDRALRFQQYGPARYFSYMEKNRLQGEGKKGFWQSAVLV